MKKLFLLMALIAMAAGYSSCQKEDYSPKRVSGFKNAILAVDPPVDTTKRSGGQNPPVYP